MSAAMLVRRAFASTSSLGRDFTLANVAQNARVPVALNKLADNPGAKKKKKRVGRGPGSKRGKTSCRGMKGTGQRGSVKVGFEGGQTPVWKNTRKFGHTNARFARRYAIVNLDRLQLWIDTGRIDASKKITIPDLLASGCVGKLRRAQVGIKVLAAGDECLTTPLHLEVTQASTKALETIQAAGGSVNLVHYTEVGLRSILKPDKYPRKPYLKPPPERLNFKLRHPMGQPEQHEEWLQRNEVHVKAVEEKEKVLAAIREKIYKEEL